VLLAAAITPDLVARGLHAGKLIGPIAKLVDGGGGGGNPHFATGGGKDPNRLSDAMQQVPEIVKAALK
jgi:alanyl-tRNA synthetase